MVGNEISTSWQLGAGRLSDSSGTSISRGSGSKKGILPSDATIVSTESDLLLGTSIYPFDERMIWLDVMSQKHNIQCGLPLHHSFTGFLTCFLFATSKSRTTNLQQHSDSQSATSTIFQDGRSVHSTRTRLFCISKVL